MLAFAAGFLAGDCAVQLTPTLPAIAWCAVLAVAAAIAGMARQWFLCALGCGAGWTLIVAHSTLAQTLPERLEGIPIEIVGAIASIPNVNESGVRFVVDTRERSADVPAHIELTWFDSQVRVAPGEVWHLRVKLRRPRGFANPGGFDYERQLLSERIGASGYILESSENRRIGLPLRRYALVRLRAAIAQQLSDTLSPSTMSGLMRGLAVGDQQAISADAWRVFAKTGTTHLVAISGFHIGVVAAFVGVLCGALVRLPQAQRWRLTRCDARAAGTIVGGAFYSALAGFSVPTQRTLVMLCVYFAMRLLRRSVPPWRSFALALVAILALDPLAPLQIGFWLSFGAVGVILLAIDGRLAVASKLQEHVHIQSVVTIGIAPVLVSAFGNISLVAPWVNLIAIPFFSLVAVPGVLIGVMLLGICPPLGMCVLLATARVLEWAWPALDWCAHLPLALWYFAERPLWALLLAFVGAVLWATPIAAIRFAGAALCLPVIIWPVQQLEPGAFTLAVLDVGQGLALVVRTRSHVLVYDAGPAFRSGRDTGELVVVPYLHHLGVTRPDVLVLSHGDLDHVGGARSMLAEMDVRRLLQGPSVKIPERPADICGAGEQWYWDGVEFTVLHPSDVHDSARNNSSCVIEVRNAGGRALLTGDVERESETALLERGAISHADIVVAAHHGSRTSSTLPFVQATHPQHVIFSAGWRNRWGFPRPEVVQRWQEEGATTYTTFRSGAIEIEVTPQGIRHIGQYRIDHPRYWRQ